MSNYSSKSFSDNSAKGLQIAIPALLTSPSIFTFLKSFSNSIRDVDQSLKSRHSIFMRGLLVFSSFNGLIERDIA